MKVPTPDSPPRKDTVAQAAMGRGVGGYAVTDLLLVAAGIALALALRIALLDFKSLDFFASLKPWYNTIREGGFAAFATGFSTYNPPYLYLLYLVARFLPNLPVVVAVKLPSLVADFACAFLVFLIVGRQSRSHTTYAVIAAFTVLFAPTVVLNSAFWGQADSLLTAGILACVYCLMIRRPAWAVAAFGIGLAFKLQAVFLAPVLLALLLMGSLPWRSLLYVPLILLLAIVPAWIAGRPFADLLNVYTYQASQFEFITMNAPSVYAWLPDTKRVFNLMVVPGVIMGAAAAYMWFMLVYRSRRPIEGRLLLEVALVSVLIVPLFLPKMHDRYFYPADVLSIAFAFLYPEMFFIPIVVVGVSFFAYQPFLFERIYLPLPVLTLALITATAVLTYHALNQLYGSAESSGEAAPRNSDAADGESIGAGEGR